MRLALPLSSLALLLATVPSLRADDGKAEPETDPPPRAMVLTFARAEGAELAPKVQGAAEEALGELGLRLIDESQLVAQHELPELEKWLVLAPDRLRIAEIKARYGADILVVVQYARRFQYEKDFYGAKQRFFKDDVRVRAIATETGEVVHSGGAEGPIEARSAGLEELARAEARRAGEKVLARHRAERRPEARKAEGAPR